MYSQCPECQTRFRVTAAALRAARGTVRCGRCGSAFDALQTLSDSLADDSALSPPPRSALLNLPLGATGAGSDRLADSERPGEDTGGDGPEITEFHFSADDIERVFIDARDWQRQFGQPDAAGSDPDALLSPAADLDRDSAGRRPQEPGDVFVHEPEAVEDITLEGERIVIEGLPEDLEREVDEPYSGPDDAVRLEPGERPESPAIEAAVDLDATDRFEILRHVPGAEAPPATMTTTPAANEPALEPARVGSPEAGAGVAAESSGDAAAETLADTPRPPFVPFRLRDRSRTLDESELGELTAEHEEAAGDRRAGVVWTVGAVLLGLVLLGQVVHHYRHELVRDARIGDALRTVYSQAGQPLAPDWDLAAFELQQWGASASEIATGAMTVRASLRNGASFAQPLPLLRMEFEDRFGGTVARRDFAPREYLKDPAQASRLLKPGDRTEAELAVVDIGPDAVGYRLDVCLRDEVAGVRCAQSPARDGQPK